MSTTTPTGSYHASALAPYDEYDRPSLPALGLPEPVPRLWRSRSDRVFAGVLGGLAEKHGWQAKPVRMLYGLWGLITVPLLCLPAIVPYVAMWSITRARGPKPIPNPYHRSERRKLVAGVLGGFCERHGWRPGLLRAAYVVGTLATGVVPGVVAYLVAWARTEPGEQTGEYGA